jgi:Class II flagellar assembly regulator
MDGISAVGRPADPVRTPRRAGGGNFTLLPERADAGRSAEVAAEAEVGGLLLLQEQDVPGQRNRAARRRCDELLRALGDLQASMLAAGTDPDVVQRLASLAAALPQAADPTLAALTRMISLRARIEIARRDDSA